MSAGGLTALGKARTLDGSGRTWARAYPCEVVRVTTPETFLRPVQQASRQCGHMPDQPRAQAVTHMIIPTEPIGSIPRPLRLIEAIAEVGGDDPSVAALYDEAIRDTIDHLNNLALSRFSASERRESECTPVRGATAIPPTAWMWTTRNCCLACSN